MKKPQKLQYRKKELTSIAMLMLRRMEINLTPIDRIIFLRLLICYGGRKVSIEDLKALAEKVKVNWLTLKKSLDVLIEKGLCKQVGKKVIQLNKVLLPQQVGCQRRGKSFDRQTQELKEDKSAPLSTKNIEIKKTASELVARYTRYDFLAHLFSLIFMVRISHKQKNADELLDLNYKQWLVLANMVLSSDQNGIVFNVGTYELSKWTGMSRNALLHAITELFNMGIIRSKLHGTLNSNLLQSVAPVYCLNLSASIWGEKRIFGNYYLVKFPKEYIPIAQQAFNLINDLTVLDQVNGKSISANAVLTELGCDPGKKIYHIIRSALGDNIREEIYFAANFEKDFGRHMQLMTPSFRLGKSSLNTDNANLSRIIFLLTYYIQSNISNLNNVEAWLNIPMPMSSMMWFKAYLTKIVLPKLQPSITLHQENSNYTQNQTKQLIEESRAKILFAICQAILRSETMAIIKDGVAVERPKHQFNLTLLPSQKTELCDRVYFSRYGSEDMPQKTAQDTFHILEFKEISDHPVEYRLECKRLDLTLEDQKKYGLFSLKKNDKS